MKEVKLLSLNVRNFKGCSNLRLTPNGRSASVYGDNAAGKTTLYDALTWLLFGKDSRGRGDFEIKPLDKNGQVRDHAAVTEVEAVLQVDGVSTKLRKTFYERWSTKRGSVDATYDGNTSEYFVDDVPSKKYEYERRVNDLVSEELFRTLTNVTWFCEGLDWKSRRKLLLDVCGAPDDQSIMAMNPEFLPLMEPMGSLSLEEFKKKLMAQRKGLNGARNTIPTRLDEQKRTIEGLATISFETLREERDAQAARLEQASGELVKLGHGTLLDGKRNEMERLLNEVQKLQTENQSHRTSQMVPVRDERPRMSAELEQVKQVGMRSRKLAENETQLIQSLQEAIERCRKEWMGADQEMFQESSCPTCGQALPAQVQETARLRFEEEKERRKAAAVSRSATEKASLKAAEERRERYLKEAEEAEEKVVQLTEALENYALEEQPEILDLPDFAAKMEALEQGIQVLRREIEALESESTAIREDINRTIDSLRRDIAELDSELAKENLLAFARKREEELRQEAQKTARELEELDRQLYLCEEFTRYKVRYIEESINAKFRLARFRLFQEQVNGGLADCCEAAYDGVPYGSLNNGMRINLGVDVIRTISEHYGLRVPLVVDNAESVVELLDAGTQVIRLVVSGNDKELRCEYEN